MDSNSLQGYQLEQQQSSSSGLLRYRSAPSSLLANLTPTFTESQALLSRLANSNSSSSKNNISKNDTVSHSFQEFPDTNTSTKTNNKGCDSKGLRRMNSGGHRYGGGGGLPPHYPRNTSSSSSCSSSMDGSLGLVMGSMGMDQKGFGVSSSLNLLRQNSSPADLFSNVSFQNGFATMKGVGNYGHVNSTSEELSPSMNRLKNQISFSSRTASSLGMLSQISEIGNEEIGANSPDDGRQGGSNGDALHYSPGFSYGSWNDAPQHSENLTGLKRGRSSNGKLFPDVQNGELGNQVHMLSHHLSLPKTSSEMIGMENLLQFPDSVPCKIRAKRGCATHPRSIAERVRRTRISERMRKLQELVPNMDKQTNTADMLDLAVDYIKDLQKQFKNLSEKRANCKCISMRRADTNQIV